MPRGTQKINGVEYVYEYESKWDSEKKYGTHKRKYIGKMVDGIFVPNKKYQLELELEASNKKKPGPVPITESRRLFYGATYLFDMISLKLGLIDDLKQCFPDTYQQILSIVYYLILEDRNPLSRFPKWALTHAHPYGQNIPSQRSSELFGSITEDAKQNFFALQAKRRLETEFLTYNTTSISSYSKTLKQVKCGLNKDHDPLPQINLALLLGKTRIPVYYRKLPGNISDVKTIQKLLTDVEFLTIKKIKFVMDRGFYSESNINEFYQKHYKFLVGAKTSLKYVKKQIDEVRGTIQSRSNYSSKYKMNYYTTTIDWDYKEVKKRSDIVVTSKRRMYLHIYHNDQKAVDDKAEFNGLLDQLEEELLTGHRNPDREKQYTKYFDIKETPVRGITITPKDEVIRDVEKNYGYFALVSNCVKDPLEALEIYRTKDVIEKTFENLKDRLNMRTTSVSSEENLEGKLFVEFIAFIILSYINKKMSDKELYKKYTLQGLLDELDIIERYDQPGKRYYIGEMTKKQTELYSILK